MRKVLLRGLLSPLWICVLSCTLASPALAKVGCGRGKTRAPRICKGAKLDVRGCCKIRNLKKRKKRKPGGTNSSWFSSWLPKSLSFREFSGVGLKADFYNSSQGADRSLGIAARTGILGLIGWGGVGSVNYRFNSQMISGHVGMDAYLMFFGLQLALAWQVDQQRNQSDHGINYGFKLMLPTSSPMFITIGGQIYTEAPTEFFVNYSVFTSL